jgi:hypothetical protein
MALEETDKEVEPRNRGSGTGMYVRPRAYTRMVDEFMESDMEKAKVTVDDEEKVPGVEEVPAKVLYNGIWGNLYKRDVEGVSVVKDGEDVYLVKD